MTQCLCRCINNTSENMNRAISSHINCLSFCWCASWSICVERCAFVCEMISCLIWPRVCVCVPPVHVCTCICVKKKEEEEENKGGWQLCKMETVSVLVKPRGASYTMFWQANLITGLFMLLSLQPGVSERACMRVFICGRGGGSWYKAYKTSRLKEWLFISLKNRMSSFFPTESENHVMFLLCGGFAFVCVRVCSKAKVLKTSQFI